MAASHSASHMIFFVAAVIAAGVIGIAIIGVGQTIASDMETRSGDLSEKMLTSLSIANDPREVPWQDGNLTIYVRNTGQVSIKTDQLLVFLDGVRVEYEISRDGGSLTVWGPGDVLTIVIEQEVSPGDHIITVATAAASDQFGFRK